MTREENKEPSRFFCKIKNHILAELAKLKKMTWKDKAWYIWEYYKFPIIITLFTAGLMISLVGSWLDPSTTYLHYTAFNLSDSTQSEPLPLTAEFHSAMGLDNYDIISYDAQYFSSTGGYDEYAVAMMQRFYAKVAAKEIDVIIMPASDHKTMESMDFYADLEETLSPDLWELVKSDAVYVTSPETNELYAGGIDVSDTLIIQHCSFTSDSVVLSAAANSQNMDHIIDLIYYIYGYTDTNTQNQ